MIKPTYLLSTELEAIRQLIQRDPLAMRVAQACIRSRAEAAMGMPLYIPAPLAQRQMTFHGPAGQRLIFDPASPHEHRDAAGNIYRSHAYDAGWNHTYHNRNANDARDCALAAAIFDDEAAGNRARDLLLQYAHAYADYPPAGRMTATWGRVHAAALDEANWCISLLWATELLHQTRRLSDADVDLLRSHLFEPVVDLLWGEWYFIHNIRMWCNAAIGSIGLAFGDRHAIRHAIHGDKGYRQQQIDGFRADGLLYEGSIGYHSYALSAMCILSEAMVRNGYEPYRDDYLLKAHLLPFDLAQPDGSIPPLNDYWPVATLPTRNMATALRRFEDDRVRAAASQAFRIWQEADYSYDRTASPWNWTTAYFCRQQVDWLLAWDKLTADLTPTPPRIMKLSASGLGVLRPDADDYLMLKCSTKGSGHDHHDKLSIIWWQQGHCWLGDMGATSYGIDLHEKWIKHTLSHNTALVDGRAHESCSAQLTQCKPSHLAGQVQPYPQQMPDVQLARHVTLDDQANLHDHLTMRASQSRCVDYILRPRGQWVQQENIHLQPGKLQGHDDAYRVLQQTSRVSFADHPALLWRQGEHLLQIILDELDPAAEVWLAHAPENVIDLTKMGVMLILRAWGKAVSFKVSMRQVSDASCDVDASSSKQAITR